MTLREVWLRLTFPLRQRRLSRELREEMELHVALRADELLAQEQSADRAGATLAARKQFGNASRIENAARDAWGWQWLDGFGQDLRYVARQLARSPVFVFVAVATIAIGIAVNAAAFTFYDSIVLKPLPVRDPASVVRIVQDRRIAAPEELPFSAYDVLRRDSRTMRFVGTGLPAVPPDCWLPMSSLPSLVGRDWRYDGLAHWQVLGRLAPGASLA